MKVLSVAKCIETRPILIADFPVGNGGNSLLQSQAINCLRQQVPALALSCYSLKLGALTHIWLPKRKKKNAKGPCDPTGDFLAFLLFCLVCASD